MRTLILGLLVVGAAPLVAQAPPNPFAFKYSGLPSYTVDYSYGGDMSGTGRVTSSGDRMASTSKTSGRFFGQQSTSETWQLTTPEEIWDADLAKKTGTKVVNPLPFMEQAYDDLSRADKERVHTNMKEMMAFVSRALPSTPFGGPAARTETVAGERCEVREWGTFSFCTMPQLPIALKTTGSMLCVSFEQTATAVTRNSDAALLNAPSGIKWTEELNRAKADSAARAWVQQLASKELADSLANARQQMQQAGVSSEQSPELTPEMCNALKEFSLSKAMGDAFAQAFDEIVADAAREVKNEAVSEAKNEAKNAVKGGLRGLIRRPE